MKEFKLRRKGLVLKKVLRALGNDVGLELPFPSEEERTSNVSPFQSRFTHIQFRNKMLEAERLKIKAIMENRRRSFV